jgi:hypothetical protein
MKKPAAKPKEKKTPGTRGLEKYRSRMNRLAGAEREKLLAQAMVTIYDQPAKAATWPKGFFSRIRLSEPSPFRRPPQGEHRVVRR